VIEKEQLNFFFLEIKTRWTVEKQNKTKTERTKRFMTWIYSFPRIHTYIFMCILKFPLAKQIDLYNVNVKWVWIIPLHEIFHWKKYERYSFPIKGTFSSAKRDATRYACGRRPLSRQTPPLASQQAYMRMENLFGVEANSVVTLSLSENSPRIHTDDFFFELE
jgi:hypothetical protein